MKKNLLFFLAVIFPITGFAGDASVMIAPAATFSSTIPSNIQTECNLATYQADAVRRHAEALGIPVATAEKDEAPPSGRFLKLRIESAFSSGNAFIGHRKQVAISAKLFEDGKEIANFAGARDSMGGAFGGFKGSCTVLERCADTLGKDVAGWLKAQLAAGNAPAKNPAGSEAPQTK
jgi:hypothetical protein